MRIWLDQAGPCRAAVIRHNDDTKADEAWDTTANAWLPLAAGGQYQPTQLFICMTHGATYFGHSAQWVDLPDSAMVSGASVSIFSADSHGYLAELLEVRPVYHMLTAIVP